MQAVIQWPIAFFAKAENSYSFFPNHHQWSTAEELFTNNAGRETLEQWCTALNVVTMEVEEPHINNDDLIMKCSHVLDYTYWQLYLQHAIHTLLVIVDLDESYITWCENFLNVSAKKAHSSPIKDNAFISACIFASWPYGFRFPRVPFSLIMETCVVYKQRRNGLMNHVENTERERKYVTGQR